MFEEYPPSPARAGAVGLGLLVWSVFAGVVRRTTGAFYSNPIACDIAATPGTVIGLFLVFTLIVGYLPDLSDVDADNLPTPELHAPPEAEQ